jgi:hypothetical protein
MARKAVVKGAKAVAKGAGGKSDAGFKVATIVVGLGAVMVVVALPLCILLVVGLAPTVVAALIDRHRRRYLARAVAATNLAGMVIPVMELLRVGISFSGVQHVLGDPRYWLIMYGAATIGWLLNFSMPSLARVYVDIRADQFQRQLEARAKELLKEWGEEVVNRGEGGGG